LWTLTFGPPSIAQSTSSYPQDSLSQLNLSLKTLAARVAPAVVEIQTAGYGADQDDDSSNSSYSKQRATGSGVILGSDGYIVTNAHVIRGAKRIRVTLTPPGAFSATAVLQNSRRFAATVVGASEDTDLAVLKIEASDLPTIPMAKYDDLRQGQLVIAVGSPLGLKNSVSMGVVSSVARQAAEDKPQVMIQTDAAINPGNSGGALVDTDGRLVGINTLSSSEGQRMGFAVPSDVVTFVYQQIRKSGRVRRGFIGVDVQSITPVIARALHLQGEWGVIVSDVDPNSPAEKVGLKPFDVILKADGKPVGSFPEFDSVVFFKREGEQLQLEVLRGQATQTLALRVTEQQDLPRANSMLGPDPESNLIATLGVFGIDVDSALANKIAGLRQASGVYVFARAPAAQDGCDLDAGDIIHSVNMIPVRDMRSLRNVLQGSKSGDPIVMQIERNRKLMYVAFEVD
jgi:serine protease Do